jgi:glutamyl-tRNA reductase
LTRHSALIFFERFSPNGKLADISWATDHSRILEGEASLQHLFYVASSIDSLVVGEREIITQVRAAYDLCNKLGLTGDRLRLLVKSTIETAKRVYTETQIAQHPVSVVSLAYRQMREFDIDHAPNILDHWGGSDQPTDGAVS